MDSGPQTAFGVDSVYWVKHNYSNSQWNTNRSDGFAARYDVPRDISHRSSSGTRTRGTVAASPLNPPAFHTNGETVSFQSPSPFNVHMYRQSPPSASYSWQQPPPPPAFHVPTNGASAFGAIGTSGPFGGNGGSSASSDALTGDDGGVSLRHTAAPTSTRTASAVHGGNHGVGIISFHRPGAAMARYSPPTSADDMADEGGGSGSQSEFSMDSGTNSQPPLSSLVLDKHALSGSEPAIPGSKAFRRLPPRNNHPTSRTSTMTTPTSTPATTRRAANRDEFDGPHQFLPQPPPDSLTALQEQALPRLPTHLAVQEQDCVLSQVNERLARCAYDFVARYQFPIPLTPDMRPVASPQDREWTEWVHLLKRLATKRRIPARVLYNGQIKQFVTVLENSLEMRHAARHQSRPLKDDRNILQLISAGLQVAKILKDAPAMEFLDRLYVDTDRQIQQRRNAEAIAGVGMASSTIDPYHS